MNAGLPCTSDHCPDVARSDMPDSFAFSWSVKALVLGSPSYAVLMTLPSVESSAIHASVGYSYAIVRDRDAINRNRFNGRRIRLGNRAAPAVRADESDRIGPADRALHQSSAPWTSAVFARSPPPSHPPYGRLPPAFGYSALSAEIPSGSSSGFGASAARMSRRP